jgi:hypothetical protein
MPAALPQLLEYFLPQLAPVLCEQQDVAADYSCRGRDVGVYSFEAGVLVSDGRGW